MLPGVCRALQRSLTKTRSIHTNNKSCNAYDSEGKTTINILNREADAGLMINGFSQVGFRLNNGMTVLGPMAIFTRSVLSWNVKDISDITEESLSLFSILEPRLDIIVLGIGDRLEDLSFHRRLFPIMKKRKLNFEILATEQACATFNFLNSEGRCVAGALIPPMSVSVTDNDLLNTKMRYQNLYERED